MNLTWILVWTAFVTRIIMALCAGYAILAQHYPWVADIFGNVDTTSTPVKSAIAALAAFLVGEGISWWKVHRHTVVVEQAKTLTTQLVNVGVTPATVVKP